MGKKERHQVKPDLLLLQRDLVSESSIQEFLASRAPASFWEILQGLGFEVRPIEAEIALMEKIKRRRARGLNVTYDESTSVRIEMVDLLIDMERKKIISRAYKRGGGRDTVKYYLTDRRENLLSQSLININSEEPPKGNDHEEIRTDVYSRPLRPRGPSSKILL